MSRRRFWVVASVVSALLVTEIAVACGGALDWSAAIELDKEWEMAAAVGALAAWVWSARRSRGIERRWRWWMAAAATSFAVGLAAWSWGQVVAGIPLPTSTLGPAGFLFTPLLAALAVSLRALGREVDHRRPGVVRRGRLVRALDLAIVAGSLLVFASVTTGEQIARGWARSESVVAILLAHPLSYLLLLAVVVVLTGARQAMQQWSTLLLALSCVAYIVSSTLFAHFVDVGVARFPPWVEVGFMTFPVLFGLAALAPVRDSARTPDDGSFGAGDVIHFAMPYVPMVATGLFLTVGVATGLHPDRTIVGIAVTLVILVIVRQVTTLVDNGRLLREVEHRALHDPLTGLANRALFLDRLGRAMAPRQRVRQPLLLLFCDVDDFKRVNDTFGHSAGDALLRALAARLRTCAGAGDTVARLGGDEFAVLLTQSEDPPVQVGRRLLDALRSPYVLNGHTVVVTVSVGVSSLDPRDPPVSLDELLTRADSAMYAAKKSGKDTVTCHASSTLG
jgi:diguanylate cyclase (GGDEF)-like protein